MNAQDQIEQLRRNCDQLRELSDARKDEVMLLRVADDEKLEALQRLIHPMADESDVAHAQEVIAKAKGGTAG